MLKEKINIIITLILFFIISIISIYNVNEVYVGKQILWYLVGFTLIIFFRKINYKKIINITPILYVLMNFILLLLLIFAPEINGSKCWIIIPSIGSLQPSEFMKIILILMNAKILTDYEKKYKNKTLKTDIFVFLKIIIITLIPSILTFLEPDTGMVIIYFFISIVMLFISGIKKSILITLVSFMGILITSFLYFYFNYQDSFISIFGTTFFYRIERLIDWSGKSGMQLTNALASIKAAGLFGFGIKNIPIYIPEAHTDFIFSSYASLSGLIGTLILIILILYFDIILLKLAFNMKNKNKKYIIIGFVAMILYQQMQNISMNIGLLPITGITLPFISYGGSSLLSYMIGIGIVLSFNIKDKNNKTI